MGTLVSDELHGLAVLRKSGLKKTEQRQVQRENPSFRCAGVEATLKSPAPAAEAELLEVYQW